MAGERFGRRRGGRGSTAAVASRVLAGGTTPTSAPNGVTGPPDGSTARCGRGGLPSAERVGVFEAPALLREEVARRVGSRQPREAPFRRATSMPPRGGRPPGPSADRAQRQPASRPASPPPTPQKSQPGPPTRQPVKRLHGYRPKVIFSRLPLSGEMWAYARKPAAVRKTAVFYTGTRTVSKAVFLGTRRLPERWYPFLGQPRGRPTHDECDLECRRFLRPLVSYRGGRPRPAQPGFLSIRSALNGA